MGGPLSQMHPSEMLGHILIGTLQVSGLAVLTGITDSSTGPPTSGCLPGMVGTAWDGGEEEPWGWMTGNEFRSLTEVKRMVACRDACPLAA